MRRGFTLIELLVATGVFLFGFTAAYGLFIAGTRARVQADGILRLSLATSSLVEEFKLEAGREDASIPSVTGQMPYAPVAYVGDGFAAVASAGEGGANPTMADLVFRYPLQPGVWYRVLSCVDEKGDPADQRATALQMDLLVVWNPAPDDALSLADLAWRSGLTDRAGTSRSPSPWPAWAAATTDAQRIDALGDYLASRGMAVRERVVIVRKASWER